MTPLAICVLMLFATQVGYALIGIPCDPETDFTNTYLVRNWKVLPHKNQEETQARCGEVNSRAGSPIWKYNPKPNNPLYVCLSYGASSMADWWALEYGWKLPSFKSYTNGRIEQGFNPRKLELRYRARAKTNPIQYYLIRSKSERDPITGEPVPIRPKGYARLLVDQAAETLRDPIDGVDFTYKATDYPMEGEWVSVISKNWDRKSAAEKLMRALRDHGPLYIQYEIPKKHWLMGTHAPIVIGYGTLPDGRIAFICHDSFGNFPKDHVQDHQGANAYRYVVADEIDEAIVFPHKPAAIALAQEDHVQVQFVNRAGQSIPVRRAFYADEGKAYPMAQLKRNVWTMPGTAIMGGKVKVYVEADYYMGKDGKGFWLDLPIEMTR